MISVTKFFILTFLVLVNIQFNLGKPYSLDRMMCDFLCEDDNGDNTTVDPNDMWDVFCNNCPTTRPRPRTTTITPIPLGAMPTNMPNVPQNNVNFPNAPRGMPGGPPPMGFVIYPSNGMNVTMTPTDGFYTWSFIPWMTQQQNQQTTTASPPPAATEAPTTAATTAAAATTAGGSSTTEGSTTAAA